MGLVISDKIRQKLAQRHGVNEEEISQCFASRERGFLEDNREDHKTNPPSKWFVAQTDFGRVLKVVFMYFPDKKEIHIKTAYEANQAEIDIYERFA